MGQYKNEVMHQDDLCKIVEEIALRAGLLNKCKIHEEVYDSYEKDDEDAYRLANSLITNCDELVAPFEGHRQRLTDLIKGIRNNYGDSCSMCEKNADD